MDRGAARSRKAASKLVQVDNKGHAEIRTSEHRASRPNAEAGPSRSRPPPSQQRQASHPKRIRPEDQSRDPALYRAKAIRDSSALIYRQEPFPLPPPKEVLLGIRRVDLEGSNVRDVSWLEGTGVTWLSLAGCPIERGWDAVGSLKELSVLNISNTGLRTLPAELASLSKLKALVAMHNLWISLDSQVIAGWPEMNSLIVSHSPNLTSLPSSLAQAYQVSKLTSSHCPRLTAAGLPDLSSLPLLRDVRMNNLPQLTTLPKHLCSWGTGDLSSAQSVRDTEGMRRGRGLESLDLGNCSLPFETVSPVFGLKRRSGAKSKSTSATPTPRWPHLRSLTLHSNPLAQTHPEYGDLLRSSPDLPGLQIIDTKRVVERKRAGEVPEFKGDILARKRKEAKMRPTGANKGGVQMRQWGGEKSNAQSEASAGRRPTNEQDDGKAKSDRQTDSAESRESKPKMEGKKRKHADHGGAGDAKDPQVASLKDSDGKKSKRSRGKSNAEHSETPKAQRPSVAVVTPAVAKSRPPAVSAPVQASAEDPSAKNPSKPKKSETSVLRVLEMKKEAKGKKESTAVDLKQLFAANEDTGLGVGEW